MECGDPRTLDATLLKSEADLSPEIMLRIINNKVKKAEEGEESKKRKKSNDLDDLNRNNGSQSDEKRIAAPAENSAITSKECDVTMGSCPFAQVRMVLKIKNKMKLDCVLHVSHHRFHHSSFFQDFAELFREIAEFKKLSLQSDKIVEDLLR